MKNENFWNVIKYQVIWVSCSLFWFKSNRTFFTPPLTAAAYSCVHFRRGKAHLKQA